MFPRYSFPPRSIAGLMRDLLLSRRRSFRRDALASVARLDPPLRVFGEENIPQTGPCVVTFNHYHREGFNAIWLGTSVAALVPVEIHLIITGELTYPGKWYAPPGMVLSNIVLHRIARAYGFTAMPPMPPRLKDVEARAAAVRAVLDFVKRTENPILALAPEGGDSPEGKLSRPASGSGRFALLLAAARLKYVPVGAYEESGEFCLQFGSRYELTVPRGLSSHERDRVAADILMKNIAELLPERLRGDFA